MARYAGIESQMLDWPEFREPRERYAYPTIDQIRTMEFVEGRDGPAGLRGLETIGPFISSDDNSKIVPLAETDIGQLYGKSEIPSYMDPTTGDIEVAGLFDQIKSGGSGGKLPTTKNKAGVLDATYVKTGVMTPQEFMDKWGIDPSDYEDLPQAFASPNSPDPVNPKDIPTDPSSPYLPGKSPYKLASNIVGYEDWTVDGPVEQGPFPALRNTRSIDQGKLKSLMDEIKDLKAKGLFL